MFTFNSKDKHDYWNDGIYKQMYRPKKIGITGEPEQASYNSEGPISKNQTKYLKRIRKLTGEEFHGSTCGEAYEFIWNHKEEAGIEYLGYKY